MTDTGGMFSGCRSLEDIFVSFKWDMSNVTSSTDMFNVCLALEGDGGVKYSNSNANDVTFAQPYIGYLKGVALPDTYN